VNPLIEIHSSPHLAECEERAFVLTAVGIPSEVTFEGGLFRLWVDESVVVLATRHLAQYEAESRVVPAPPPPPPEERHGGAWIGALLYAFVLLGASFAIARGIGPLDAFARGELDASRVQQGEWWRAVTALVLHRDAEHLAGNLVFGVWIGYFAGRRLGPGLAWCAIVLSASLANLLDALIGPAVYRSVGASTALFAAIGILAAYTWRERHRTARRWAPRWGPLVAGIVLLGWTGSQGENTDLVAHAAGFVLGAVTGSLLALPSASRLRQRTTQGIAGLATFALLAVAWIRALV
jgi:Uncharacterized membrane protein (homolog of Drosophila rhomboid)